MLGFLQVTTNGIIAMSESPAKETHPGPFPPTFGAVAPFLADLDTTDGLGESTIGKIVSSVTQLAAECVQRGVPRSLLSPGSAVVVTFWESVAPLPRASVADPTLEGSTPSRHRGK